jgi:hypothetical protein
MALVLTLSDGSNTASVVVETPSPMNASALSTKIALKKLDLATAFMADYNTPPPAGTPDPNCRWFDHGDLTCKATTDPCDVATCAVYQLVCWGCTVVINTSAPPEDPGAGGGQH